MNLEKYLVKIGLNEKQAKVYLASLELGAAPVNKISKKSGLIRTTVYEVLETLKQKGFVSHYLNKKVSYYLAQDPEKIIELIKEKVKTIENILPQLRAINGNSTTLPSTRLYQGYDGIKLIMEEILSEAKELLCFGSVEDLFKEMPDYHQEFIQKRIKKKIPLRLILKNTTKSKERKKIAHKYLMIVKILPENIDFFGMTFIWKNKIAMFSWRHNLVGVVVTNEVLSDTHKAMFESTWNFLD
jgi:HTH-type transcriptional regulator, sugar sensing transcriptional regulator